MSMHSEGLFMHTLRTVQLIGTYGECRDTHPAPFRCKLTAAGGFRRLFAMKRSHEGL